MPNERWPNLAAEYQDACARLTLIKPEIKPVLDLGKPEETARMIDVAGYRSEHRTCPLLLKKELREIEQHAKDLIHAYNVARFKRAAAEQMWLFHPLKGLKRSAAKL